MRSVARFGDRLCPSLFGNGWSEDNPNKEEGVNHGFHGWHGWERQGHCLSINSSVQLEMSRNPKFLQKVTKKTKRLRARRAIGICRPASVRGGGGPGGCRGAGVRCEIFQACSWRLLAPGSLCAVLISSACRA